MGPPYDFAPGPPFSRSITDAMVRVEEFMYRV